MHRYMGGLYSKFGGYTPQPALSAGSALRVDDDQGVHSVVDEQLRADDMLVLHTCDPMEGIKLAAQELPDIILLDLQRPHTYPPSGDLLARVVYSARASDVRTVIVDGKVLVEDGELLSADVKGILAASKRAAEQLAARVD